MRRCCGGAEGSHKGAETGDGRAEPAGDAGQHGHDRGECTSNKNALRQCRVAQSTHIAKPVCTAFSLRSGPRQRSAPCTTCGPGRQRAGTSHGCHDSRGGASRGHLHGVQGGVRRQPHAAAGSLLLLPARPCGRLRCGGAASGAGGSTWRACWPDAGGWAGPAGQAA